MEAYPAAQSELRSALKAAFPGSPSVEKILEADIPYLDAVCEEALRLAGAAKASLRQAIVDTEILGCKIRKGTEIVINLHIDRSPAPVEESKRSASSQAAVARQGNGLQDIAGRDVASFEPRRWLVKDEKTGEEVFNAYAIPCIAFGGGYRGCSGELADGCLSCPGRLPSIDWFGALCYYSLCFWIIMTNVFTQAVDSQ